MEATDNWYEDIEKEISSLKEKVSKSDSKLYELDLLSRVAKRVGGFSADCEHCQAYRNDISNLITNLENLPMTNEEVADYNNTLRNIIKHLKNLHGLHKSLPNPVYPLVTAVLIAIISWAIGGSGPGYMDDWQFGVAILGFLIAIAILTRGLIVSIIRLLIKRI